MTENDTETDALPYTTDATGNSASAIIDNIARRMASPPGTRTPPSRPVKNTMSFPETTGNRTHYRNISDAVDPVALASALKDYDEAGRRRERTPGTSPSRKRQRVYGDR